MTNNRKQRKREAVIAHNAAHEAELKRISGLTKDQRMMEIIEKAVNSAAEEFRSEFNKFIRG